LLNQIKQKRLSHAGHYINFRNNYSVWLSKSVRYTSDCCLQSAGEAQSSVAGYQTDTRHYRPLLWRRQLSSSSSSSSYRATYRHFGARVPTYAETNKRLHTSPPEHTTVWSRVKVHSIWMPSLFRQII